MTIQLLEALAAWAYVVLLFATACLGGALAIFGKR